MRATSLALGLLAAALSLTSATAEPARRGDGSRLGRSERSERPYERLRAPGRWTGGAYYREVPAWDGPSRVEGDWPMATVQPRPSPEAYRCSSAPSQPPTPYCQAWPYAARGRQ